MGLQRVCTYLPQPHHRHYNLVHQRMHTTTLRSMEVATVSKVGANSDSRTMVTIVVELPSGKKNYPSIEGTCQILLTGADLFSICSMLGSFYNYLFTYT